MSIEAKKETRGFETEAKQLLHLMIHSLYSNKEVFLRELISNASDAADKLRFEGLSSPDLYEADSTLQVRIDFDKDAGTITISDNGIGMSRDEVISHLGTIAKSGTAQFLAGLSGDQRKDAQLIGQFGVGFYSAFIVASKVEVLTRRAGLPIVDAVHWISSGEADYSVETVERAARGTTVILHLRPEELDFADNYRLRHIVKKYADHISIPVLMPKESETESQSVEKEYETVNAAQAGNCQRSPTLRVGGAESPLYRVLHALRSRLNNLLHLKISSELRRRSVTLHVESALPLSMPQ